MRLVGRHDPKQSVNRASFQLLRAALRVPCRTINTKPRHERPQPVIEHVDLRRQPNPRAQSIGVLGGGLTGLTTAWHLSQFLPDAKITIYEKQNRVGGWLNSETVQTDEGEVLFEWGPRSLRPDPAGAGRATIHLLIALKLGKDLIGVSKSSPAALGRFIYYDGRLVKMPGPNPSIPPIFNAIRNGYKVITEPVFNGLLGSALAEPWVQRRPSNMADESVGDFIRRRFGKTAADNIASAFFHGIYAGDLYKLSARTILSALWYMETRDPEGSGILMEMADFAIKGHGLMQYKFGRYLDLLAAATDSDSNPAIQEESLAMTWMRDISAYTCSYGLKQIPQRLQEKLQENPNVEIRTETDVVELRFDPENKQTSLIMDGVKEASKHDYIVSTISASKLADFYKSSAASRGAKPNPDTEQALRDSNQTVNVGVVNLYYSNPNLIPPDLAGFGYLIPRTVDADQNPERALGVLFASETSGLRGEDAIQTIQNTEKKLVNEFLKVVAETRDQPTVPQGALGKNINKITDEALARHEKMIEDAKRKQKELANEPDAVDHRVGQDTTPGTKLTLMFGGHWWDGWSEQDLPNEDQLIDMAKTLLARQLKIMEAPLVAKARVNRNCIPQYHVGYRQRMASVHRGLMEEFQGRLKVAGPWWSGGVGINDSILSAHMTAFNIREEWDDETGLKEYTEREKWLILDRRTHTFSVDGEQ